MNKTQKLGDQFMKDGTPADKQIKVNQFDQQQYTLSVNDQSLLSSNSININSNRNKDAHTPSASINDNEKSKKSRSNINYTPHLTNINSNANINNHDLKRSFSLKIDTANASKDEPVNNNQTAKVLDTRMLQTPVFRHISHVNSLTYNEGFVQPQAVKYTNKSIQPNTLILNDIQSAKFHNTKCNSNIIIANTMQNSQILNKSLQKSEEISYYQQTRKFKIFPEPVTIKFSIPPLEEYYYKSNKNEAQITNNNIITNNNLNNSMGVGQNSVNKNLNNSIMDFRYSQKFNKKGSGSAYMDTTISNMLGSNITKKNRFKSKMTNQLKDQIKQQKQDEQDQTEQIQHVREQQARQEKDKDKEKGRLETTFAKKLKNLSESQIKGVYLLLGFLISTILMLLAQYFM